MFQLTFAAITPALIIGAVAERTKFSAILFFIVLWFTFSYLPMAHMVWWWAGPEFAATHTADETISISGLIWGFGALDFAGGTVVHINAGVAGLVAAIMVGPRVGYLKENMAPHNLVFTLIGACLLWVGWFGFNAGSNLEANGYAAIAVLNTIVATAAAALDLEPARRLDPRPRQPARRRLRRRCRPGRGDAGRRVRRPVRRDRHRHRRRRGLSLGGGLAEGQAEIRRLRSTCSASMRVGGIIGAILTGVVRQPGARWCGRRRLRHEWRGGRHGRLASPRR